MNTELKFENFLELLSDQTMSGIVGQYCCRGMHEEFLSTLTEEQKEEIMDSHEFVV